MATDNKKTKLSLKSFFPCQLEDFGEEREPGIQVESNETQENVNVEETPRIVNSEPRSENEARCTTSRTEMKWCNNEQNLPQKDTHSNSEMKRENQRSPEGKSEVNRRERGSSIPSVQKGMVCVIECELPLNEIRSYLGSIVQGQVGPCTVIYSGQRATRNTVAVVGIELFSLIEREVNEGHGPITKISRYVISHDNSPRYNEGQTEDIFLRFTASRDEMPRADELGASLLEIINGLIRFGIIDEGAWSLDLPLKERNSSRVPMTYAFVKKKRQVPPEQSICLRAVLNGSWLEKCDVNVGAYWSDRGINRRNRNSSENRTTSISSNKPSSERRDENERGEMRARSSGTPSMNTRRVPGRGIYSLH